MAEAVARRCTICAINWRPIDANKKCHQCGEQTTLSKGVYPIPDDEALELAGPISIGQDAYGDWPLRNLTEEDEAYIAAFAAWLETVGPEDFRKSINYPPGHPNGCG